MYVRPMSIRYVKKDWGSGRLTWRICDGTYKKREVASTLRKVTNRKLKIKLWFNGKEIRNY